MKKLRIVISAFAFLLAIGASYALVPKSQILLQNVKGKHASCPTGVVSDTCDVNNSGPACTFFVGFPIGIVEAIPFSTECKAEACLAAPVLKLPL